MTNNQKAEIRLRLQAILNELECETSPEFRKAMLQYIDRATAELGGLPQPKQEN